VKAWNIINLPAVWAKLMGKDTLTRTGMRKLTRIVSERHQRMDRARNAGLTGVDADAFYDRPKSHGKDDET